MKHHQYFPIMLLLLLIWHNVAVNETTKAICVVGIAVSIGGFVVSVAKNK